MQIKQVHMKKLISIFVLMFSQWVFAMPAQILIMRHGEKPLVDNGQLSAQGWQRAQALPQLFSRPEFMKFGPPAALYGMAPKDETGSVRAIQTLKYVSEKFNLSINQNFKKKDIQELVQDIQQNRQLDGKMIVICWEHEYIEFIEQALGVQNVANWPGDQFDRVLSLTFNSQGNLTSFANLPEKLLPGDSQK
jgi:hypothetical protein